jgi:hypothetical protein
MAHTYGIFTSDAALDTKQQNLLADLSAIYTPDIIGSVLVPIITQRDTLSLRVLDWLVTNYAKKNSVVYTYRIKAGGEGTTKCLINVYSQYKSWLRNYRRRNFDPFRRRNRVCFTHDNQEYQTTVGQLNFIRWSYEYGVLDYTRTHLCIIEEDMNTSLNKVREKRDMCKQKNKTRKRSELSTYPHKKCFVYSTHSVHDPS